MRNLNISGIHNIKNISLLSYHIKKYNYLYEDVINEEDGNKFSIKLNQLIYHSEKCLAGLLIFKPFFDNSKFQEKYFKYSIPNIIQQFILQDYDKALEMSLQFEKINEKSKYYFEAINLSSKSLIMLKTTLPQEEYIQKYGITEHKLMYRLKDINQEMKGNGSLLEYAYLLHLNGEEKLSKRHFTRFINTHGIEESFDQAFGYGVNTWFYKNVEIFVPKFFNYLINMAIHNDHKILSHYSWDDASLKLIKKINSSVGEKLENLQITETKNNQLLSYRI